MLDNFKDDGEVHEIYTNKLPENLNEFKTLMVDEKIPESGEKPPLLFIGYSMASTVSLALFLFMSLYWGNKFTFNVHTNITINIIVGVSIYSVLTSFTFRFLKNAEKSKREGPYIKLLENKTEFLQQNPQFDKLLAIYSLEGAKYEHLNAIYIDEYFKYFDRVEEYRRDNFEFRLFQKNLNFLNNALEAQSLKDKYNL